MTAIVLILGLLLGGIAYLSRAYGIGAMDQEQANYQSVISQIVGAVVGRGAFYYITIASVLAVLALSANTSFADFPRLSRMLALDGFLPRAFTGVGRRLVYSFGILVLAVLSGVLLIIFGGITDRLIPLFAIGAFTAFTLSQAGMVMHWKRAGGTRSRAPLLINGLGATVTFVAVIVILVAKFVEGAWITLILVPALLLMFDRVRRHYSSVSRQISCPRPLDLSQNEAPVVVVPIEGWNLITEKALRFGLRLSADVIAAHVSLDERDDDALRKQWAREVEAPSRRAGLNPPRLEIIPSPYRLVVVPLDDYINKIKDEYPDRLIAVVIPELVETHWYESILHNHRATWLKTDLLLKGDQRVVVINVPWYLGSLKDQG